MVLELVKKTLRSGLSDLYVFEHFGQFGDRVYAEFAHGACLVKFSGALSDSETLCGCAHGNALCGQFD